MHLNEGEIRAFFDNELSAEKSKKIESHLESCSKCQLKAEYIQSRSQRVRNQFESLEAAASQVSSSKVAAQAKLAKRLLNLEKENNDMWKNLFLRLPRSAWVTLTIIAVLAISLTFPSVRAAANSFLGLFRVEHIQVVQFDTDKVSEKLSSSSQLEQILGDNIQLKELGEPEEVISAEQASDMVGFPVRTLNDKSGASKIIVQPGATMEVNADIDLIQTVLFEIGHADIKLPSELDGASIKLEIPAGVTAQYGLCEHEDIEYGSTTYPDPEDDESQMKSSGGESNCTTLIQVPSPTISAPPGLDISLIGEAYLQVLGMSQEEAAHFSQNVDWTTTFIIPIPQYYADYEDVVVDGVTGTLIQDKYYSTYILLWVKDGIVHSLSGEGNKAQALGIANELK